MGTAVGGYASRMTNPDVDERLLELEHGGWRALCDGTGAGFYGRLMTDEALMILANGQVMTRQEVVDALTDAPPWAGYEILEPKVVAIADGVMALVYVGVGRRDGTPEFRGAMASTYRRTDDGWRLALYQQTARTA